MPTRTKVLAGLAATAAAGALALSAGLIPAGATAPARTVGVPAAARAADPPNFTATLARAYDTFDAHQAVAVDKKYFYVVDNRSITKHDRATGKPLLQFVASDDGPIIHMDSAAVVGDRLYTAHSNYDDSPEKSSIEVYDTRTMKHVQTFGFGIYRGSPTWIDRHDGAWWAGFANYDVVPDGRTEPYGRTDDTQIVKMDDHFQVVESWGIAWDRSGGKPTLWAIKRSTSQALSFSVPYRSIGDPKSPAFQVLGPGHFQQ